MGDLVIPAKLATTSVAWVGEDARAWLARLPAIVDEVAEQWGLDVGAPLEPGGNISWVAPARRRSDGLDAILKVQLPHPESDPEAVALEAWDGDGAVRLYDHDPDRCALLIEACRPGRGLRDEEGTVASVRAGAEVLARLHRPSPPPGVPDLADLLDAWADELEGIHDRAAGPDPALFRRAIDTMRTRPRASATSVLLHGDLNPTNILSAEREPWLAIDPKPLVGDPAFDGRRLVCQPDPRASGDPAATLVTRLQIVAAATDVDEVALREWCLVDAIEIGSFARARADLATVEQCDGLVALLAPLLP